MRFEEIYGRFDKGRLRCEEAADLLGMSLSSFRRRRRRFEDEGLEGLVDRRLGKASARRVPVDEVTRILALFETHYQDFTVKHFHEKLVSARMVSRSPTAGPRTRSRRTARSPKHRAAEPTAASAHAGRCLA